MKAALTITDLTRMSRNRVCLAGYTDDGQCVRPELPYPGITEDWLYRGRQAVVRPFACVEVELRRHTPHPPHTEDWEISALPPVPRGDMPARVRKAFLEGIADRDVLSIFGAPVQHDLGWWVRAGEGNRSLGTVKARIWDVFHTPKEDGRWDYRLVFSDSSGQTYRLSVTDLAFRLFVDHCREAGRVSGKGPADSVTKLLKGGVEVFLRVGLARRWSKFEDRCYLQVNGIYSFPDYLGGRCFADFSQPRTPDKDPQRSQPRDLRGAWDDLPF